MRIIKGAWEILLNIFVTIVVSIAVIPICYIIFKLYSRPVRYALGTIFVFWGTLEIVLEATGWQLYWIEGSFKWGALDYLAGATMNFFLDAEKMRLRAKKARGKASRRLKQKKRYAH